MDKFCTGVAVGPTGRTGPGWVCVWHEALPRPDSAVSSGDVEWDCSPLSFLREPLWDTERLEAPSRVDT